ncbi:MAG: hypothetical protein A2Y12_06160 [Planctomycetes bacterium GWF2_42_9]|nr:MAG: hypothetical protein A2Y12_06160 [Planctomycetes bacterium GWF2_42_9]HAL45685.1 hypothetical protein [Phycisphaerales bacterium]
MDLGFTSRIEEAIAAKLATITTGGKKVFKIADTWKHQIKVDQAGGVQGFQQFAPFGFAKFSPPTDSTREGDGVLNQRLRFAIFIGQTSKEAGIARIGDANHIGVSLMRDLVIAAFDSWHPGEGFNCNELKYLDEVVEVDEPFNYGLDILFIADWIA